MDPALDDPPIAEEAALLRRLTPYWVLETATGWRVTSQAFQDRPRPDGQRSFSVYVEDRLAQLGLSEQDVLTGYPGYGLAAVAVVSVRELELDVELAPDPDDGERGKAHAEVVGQMTNSRRSRLAAACAIRVMPTE
jgi:hypothetical protein